jgi:hypothetical protein
LFTTSFGTVTSGTLKPLINAGSLSLSMTLTNISQGVGLSVSLVPGRTVTAYSLNPFDADATIAIVADPIPEPASALLLVIGAMLAVANTRRQ